MKKLIMCLIAVFFVTSAKSASIYDTLNDPKVAYVYNIHFPILQQFSVVQDSKITNVTVGVPTKVIPGRQLSVLLYTQNRDLLQTYTVPSDYYYNLDDHYYTFNTNNYNLPTGNYWFGVKMSNGPTGWIQTTGGMLGKIDSYCVPEISTYLMGAIAVIVFAVTKLV